MDLNATNFYFDKFKADNLSLVYLGAFSDDITSKAINLSERNIENVEELSKMKNRVSFLMAECFQNIVRHAGEGAAQPIKERPDPGLFLTRNIGGVYYITSANLVENENIDDLRFKLESVNVLDKDELKALYKEVLANGEISNKGGAGLGLIEMARKSGHKLEFDFEKVNDELSVFYLQVKLMSKRAEEESEDQLMSSTLEEARILYDKMREGRILLVHKGDYGQDSMLPVLKMIESNIQNELERFSVKKIVYHILVEVLQNITLHAAPRKGAKDGIFMMGRDNGHYIINAGNYIKTDEVEEFKRQLHQLNSLDKSELDGLYRKTLKAGHILKEGGVGLGLIDIARESANKLKFDFAEVDEETSFFNLSIKV